MNRRSLILSVLFLNVFAVMISVTLAYKSDAEGSVLQVFPKDQKVTFNLESYEAIPMFALGRKSYFSLKQIHYLNNEEHPLTSGNSFYQYPVSFPSSGASSNVISDIYSFYCLSEFAQN